jgi:ABC-type amino acid transport substrate-binding protein
MPRISFAFIILLWVAQVYGGPGTVVLDGPGKSNAALFVQDVLDSAYQQLDYKVDYLALPLGRSFVEANEGRIDGLRFRVDNTAEKYPNLIAVPYPLLEFNVVLIADRRKCGMCDIQQMQKLATVRGLKAVEDEITSEQFSVLELDIVQYTNVQQALVLLKAQKIDGVIMSDIDLPTDLFKNSPYLIKQTLSTRTDFHYLHNKHQDLVKQLLTVLQQMEDAGIIQQLRDKYKIAKPAHDPMHNTALGKVSAISGNWVGFTDTNDGGYWRLLKDIFQGENASFGHQVGNWKRAKAKFARGDLDMLVGAYAYEADESMLLSDLHIDYETSVYALASDEDKLSKLLGGELPGSACYVIGYDFNQFLPATISIHETENGTDCERLLQAGRVDMLVGYDLDMSEQLRLNYASELVLDAQPLFVVFHNNNRGKLLHGLFEKKFRQILMDGKLGDYYKNPADQISSHLLMQKASRH